MATTTDLQAGYLRNLGDLERRLATDGPDWLQELRRQARAGFDAGGFPTPDVEEWKNTNVGPLVATAFVAPGQDAAGRTDAGRTAIAQAPRLVFVDGRLSREESDFAAADGVWVGSLSEALRTVPERVQPYLTSLQDERLGAFQALNTTLFEDGAVVLIPESSAWSEPVHICHRNGGIGNPVAVHARTLVVVGRGSRATVVERHIGEGEYLTNAVTELWADDNASIDHYRLQLESDSAYHLSATLGRQGRDAHLRTFTLDLGGRLVRHDSRTVLGGEGGTCEMNGLYITRNAQHVDNHTILDHAQPHCDSRELFKGILSDRSRSVFTGRIVVRQDAQKTDAKQSNPNLILSETALAHTRPQLEIYADDVKCTHGATVGKLDADAIFYLRSRGLSDTQARRLMISAFAGEVLDQVRIESLRSEIERRVEERLAALEG